MKKIAFVWSQWKSRAIEFYNRLRGITPEVAAKNRPSFDIGSVERFDNTPKRQPERIVRLGQVNDEETVSLGSIGNQTFKSPRRPDKDSYYDLPGDEE